MPCSQTGTLKTCLASTSLKMKSIDMVLQQKEHFLERLGPYLGAEEQLPSPHQLGTTVRAVFEGIVLVVINTDQQFPANCGPAFQLLGAPGAGPQCPG